VENFGMRIKLKKYSICPDVSSSFENHNALQYSNNKHGKLLLRYGMTKTGSARFKYGRI